MQFSFDIGNRQTTRIDFFRDSFMGTVSITADGEEVYSESAFNPLTHGNLSLKRQYCFSITDPEYHDIVIEKTRPIFLAGFRQSRYEVYCDGYKIGDFSG